MGKGVQVKANRDRRLARNKKMHQESEMARGGKREGRGGKGKSATQLGSYWLGWEFFYRSAAAAAAEAAAVAAAA